MKTNAFATYLRGFDDAERVAMKIGSEELLASYAEGRIELVDIRFDEEVAAWRLGFGLHIPLPALPDRPDDLDRDRLIVRVCPHDDYAGIARQYLTLVGFESHYPTEGLLGVCAHRRGDRTRDYLVDLDKRR